MNYEHAVNALRPFARMYRANPSSPTHLVRGVGCDKTMITEADLEAADRIVRSFDASKHRPEWVLEMGDIIRELRAALVKAVDVMAMIGTTAAESSDAWQKSQSAIAQANRAIKTRPTGTPERKE